MHVFVDMMHELDVLHKMSEFDQARSKFPLHVFARNYMQMVLDMLAYIRAVRTGD